MFFKKKQSPEHAILTYLGFEGIIQDTNKVQEIIGLAKKPNRINFFIQLIRGDEQPGLLEINTFQERVRLIKDQYATEKEYLIGHLDEPKERYTLDNKAVIQALVEVTDPLHSYRFLGALALYMYMQELATLSFPGVIQFFTSDSTLTKQRLQECPFLKFIESDDKFEFVLRQFQYYYAAQELSRFEQPQFKGSLPLPFPMEIAQYVDYSKAPQKILDFYQLLQRMKEKQKQYVQEQHYEKSAQLRDTQYKVVNQHSLPNWWEYEKLDLHLIETEINKILMIN